MKYPRATATILLLILCIALPINFAAAYTPASITLSPTSGLGTILISAEDFGNSWGTLVVKWNGASITFIIMSGEGSGWHTGKVQDEFVLLITVQTAVAGSYIVTVEKYCDTKTASATFIVPDMTGPAGPTGPTGEQGPAGADGADGEDGADGVDGVNGTVGPQGETGATGADGKSVMGPQGPQGEQGPQGIQGIQGEKGDKGDKGDMGEVGPTGLPGIQGIPGVIGPVGPQGMLGVAGEVPLWLLILLLLITVMSWAFGCYAFINRKKD